MIHLGIDLGTTYSVVAYVNAHGVPTLFPDKHDANEFRTPSVVHIDGNTCLVGTPLELLLEDEPGLQQARFVKLLMGDNDNVYIDSLKREWKPEGISALILKKLHLDVQTFSAEDVMLTVIAVPANFGDAQRRATRHAAQLAGVNKVQLVEEPVAAATFYGFSEKAGDQTLLVYDFGGGTFDATVLQTAADGLYALATDGSNEIGGKSIDDLIMQQIANEFLRVHKINLYGDVASETELRRVAQEIKLALNKPGKGQVQKTLLLAGRTVDFMLTRSQLNALIEPLIDETITICERCLSGAGFNWAPVDKILLTGGSSLMPLVTEKLLLASGKSPDAIVCRQPHQAVAYGAALIAEQLAAKEEGKQSGQGLQSISSYDLGLRIFDKKLGGLTVKPLIRRNAPLPAEHNTTFYTTRHDQSRMVIEVVQQKGESNDVTSLGHFAFGPIRNPRKNYPVEITLKYDEEGLVKVTAKDTETGEVMEQIIEDGEGEGLAHLTEHREWVNSLRINE